VAALVASIARPPEEDGDLSPSAQRPGSVADGTATRQGGTVTIALRAGGRRETRRLAVNRPATVVVSVEEPGQVAIPSLGVVESAEPFTPAHFDVLVPEPGRHRVELDPADPSVAESVVGTLDVTSRRSHQ
jgi:hypothetical protein